MEHQADRRGEAGAPSGGTAVESAFALLYRRDAEAGGSRDRPPAPP